MNVLISRLALLLLFTFICPFLNPQSMLCMMYPIWNSPNYAGEKQAELSYNVKRSDSCRCESQEAGVLQGHLQGVKGQSQWGSVQDSQQDVLLNKLLLYSITSVDLRLQLTSAVLCRDLQTDNALLCGLHWIWQNHIHTRSFSSSLDRTHPMHLNGQHHSYAQPEME